MLSEQYYPISGKEVLALGAAERVWVSFFGASASQGRAAKYSFYSQHFLFFLLWLGEETGFTQTSQRLEPEVASFCSFLLPSFFHFNNKPPLPLPHVKALKYSHIVIGTLQMKTVFAQVAFFFLVAVCFVFFFNAESEHFLRASPEHVGSRRDVTNSRKNTCSNQLSITTAATPSAAPLASTTDDGSGSARLTLPTECHVNCPAADAVKTRHLGAS